MLRGAHRGWFYGGEGGVEFGFFFLLRKVKVFPGISAQIEANGGCGRSFHYLKLCNHTHQKLNLRQVSEKEKAFM